MKKKRITSMIVAGAFIFGLFGGSPSLTKASTTLPTPVIQKLDQLKKSGQDAKITTSNVNGKILQL
ncbi:hypothetical protein [Neobacillus niacini]|uniref:hypothetical protein n=1 Tax=Neobacillus niacini TaxID=86668 RepID=UPI00285F436B|nr:hypothetical protein [Neobacillus niacini]MDR6999113.1 hypothetical protein [Neobacillus niacini]